MNEKEIRYSISLAIHRVGWSGEDIVVFEKHDVRVEHVAGLMVRYDLQVVGADPWCADFESLPLGMVAPKTIRMSIVCNERMPSADRALFGIDLLEIEAEQSALVEEMLDAFLIEAATAGQKPS